MATSSSDATLCSTDSPESISSGSTLVEERKKPGRPKEWTDKRLRRFSRLYIYSDLPRKDLQAAICEKKWTPKIDAVAHYTRTIFGADPRWLRLRPKNRKDMNTRINGLNACHVVKKETKENSPTQVPGDLQHIDTTGSWTDTPLEDLLSQAPAAPHTSRFYTTANTYNSALSHPPLPEYDANIVHEAWNQNQRQPVQLGPLKLFPSTSFQTKAPSIGQSALSTHISTSSIQRRLPQYSIRYVKKIVRLLNHSVIEAPACATTVAHSVSTRQGNSIMRGSAAITAETSWDAPSTEIMFPGIFLVLDKCIEDQGLCIPGLKPHDKKTCWCAVVEELGPQRAKFWSLEGDQLDVNLRDEFDNTTLHLVAARGASWSLMVDLIELGANVNAKNVAGQNFLHVWSCRHALDHYSIGKIYETLATHNFEFNHCDLFGRSFFHMLIDLGLSVATLGHRFDLKGYIASTRDALGRIIKSRPVRVTTGDVWQLSNLLSIPEDDLSSVNAANDSTNSSALFNGISPKDDKETSLHNCALQSPLSLDPVSGQRVNYTRTTMSSTTKAVPEEGYLSKHARLAETARRAFVAPWIEDPEGRNGLQCIAEAVLAIHVEDGRVVSSNSSKRKRGQPGIPTSSLRLHLRYQLVQNLVSSGVDVNNYDNCGSTVLMAFIKHLPEGEDDKTLSKILEHLLRSGANLHRRNREGHTALCIAVCLGRKVATRVLLDYGANIHARTLDGTGILLEAEDHYFKAHKNPQLYASILACMALVIDYGAKPSPTLVQEWLFQKTNSVKPFY